MEIKYKNTEKQFLDFSMYRAVNSKSYKRSVKMKTAMISVMLIVASIVYGYVSMQKSSDEKIMKVGLVFSGIFFVLGIINIFVFKSFIYKSLEKTIQKSLKNSRDIFGRTFKIRFDGKSINVFSGKSKLDVEMSSFTEVVELNECVCLAVENGAGLVIPFSAFKKKDDRTYFINEMRAYIENNK